MLNLAEQNLVDIFPYYHFFNLRGVMPPNNVIKNHGSEAHVIQKMVNDSEDCVFSCL